MRELSRDALIVYLSDSHIGGDPGCDSFESPEELRDLLHELAGHSGPVELILAGDFFDLLEISDPPPGIDRVELTIQRPEYKDMFGALKRFADGAERRVVYLPGNHDAEVWWNPQVQETLREAGLVHEFMLSHQASLGAPDRQFTVYCEHGNQFDPQNQIEDYSDPLDTPLGHHIVTDFTRRIAPLGEVVRGLNISDIKNVYPLAAVPQWVASKYFYSVLGQVVTYLMIPFILSYVAYRLTAFYLVVSRNLPLSFSQSYLALPRVHEAFSDIVFFTFLSLLLFSALFWIFRRNVRKFVSVIFARELVDRTIVTEQRKIEEIVIENGVPPMFTGEAPPVDVFVSGHTHIPGLKQIHRKDGRTAVVANSGCWLRQLWSVPSHIKGPRVFASKFVLTHVRVFMRGSNLRVELWEHPKPGHDQITRIERLASWGRRPRQPAPGAKPRVIASYEVPEIRKKDK